MHRNLSLAMHCELTSECLVSILGSVRGIRSCADQAADVIIFSPSTRTAQANEAQDGKRRYILQLQRALISISYAQASRRRLRISIYREARLIVHSLQISLFTVSLTVFISKFVLLLSFMPPVWICTPIAFLVSRIDPTVVSSPSPPVILCPWSAIVNSTNCVFQPDPPSR